MEKKDGEMTAFFSERYRELYGILTFWIARQVRNRDLAEDLASESFAAAWESLEQLKDPERFKAWLFTIASNAVKNWVRKWKRREMVPFEECEETETADPYDFIADLERYEELRRIGAALRVMKCAQRAAIYRAASSRPCQGVYGSRLHYARKSLAAKLQRAL